MRNVGCDGEQKIVKEYKRKKILPLKIRSRIVVCEAEAVVCF